MKVKNEYIEIKIGDKIHKKQNMILNTYINRLFASQLDTVHSQSNINNCYLKLDTPIENVDYDTVLSGNDFDIELINSMNNVKIESTLNKTTNSVKVKTNFTSNPFFEYKGVYYSPNEIEIFKGRKITAIGFGYGNTCFAFLDTNNMNIVINTNEEIRITRVDSFTTDGICSGIDYPLHLVNDFAYKDYVSSNNSRTMAQLYSVGFGNTLGYMEEEYLVDSVLDERTDTTISFDIGRTRKVGHYPSETLMPGFYPTKDNSKYLIFKYRLYREYYEYDEHGDSQRIIEYLDEYYTENIKNENFGNLNVKLKLERL